MSTKISWTNETWNPVSGCSHVSEGCRNCYAETLSLRYKYTNKPWTVQNAAENVVLHPDRVDKPKHWKKPRRVFVNSMSDLFHERIPLEFIRNVFWVMATTPQHTYQILTKRPARMLEVLKEFQAGRSMPFDEDLVNLPNVWLGVSVEDQRAADERIPLLLQTPAAVRFLSCEPLLGEIDLFSVDGTIAQRMSELNPREPNFPADCVDWVIVGGESGANHRPMNLDWARSIRDQCIASDVPFFFKQESAFRSETNPTLDGVGWHQYPRELAA